MDVIHKLIGCCAVGERHIQEIGGKKPIFQVVGSNDAVESGTPFVMADEGFSDSDATNEKSSKKNRQNRKKIRYPA
jgi:hypothetical protein